MKHALLADGTDLATWANRRDAQGDLPRLLRWLVHSTLDRVSRVGFPAGEGVQLGGWDGIVETDEGNAFVPMGTSTWEMGVNQDIKSKADDDYEKRTKDPRGVDPTQSTFIFVTPRRWSKKEEWATGRKAERRWQDVRVYDADDLEEWLDLSPAVHVRISIMLGKCPEGVVDIESWWVDWSHATRPPIAIDLIHAGRAETVEQVHTWLRQGTGALALQAQSRDEALAVFSAALMSLPDGEERSHHLSRALLVTDLTAWSRIATSAQPLLLVPEFDSPDATSRALRRGHRVFVPLGQADVAPTDAIAVPQLGAVQATDAFIGMGIERREAGELAALARRGFTPLRRRLAVSPDRQRPLWAKPEEALSLCPAMLAGTWDDACTADREALATLAGTEYEAVTSCLVRWWRETDAPVRQVANKWIVTSKEEMWSLLAGCLTRDILERFEKVAVAVLVEGDPRYALPRGERWLARVRGRGPLHSGLLKEGIADTLALMAARDRALGSADSARDLARTIVRQVLDVANADWRVWASLSSLLPLLAEAAPDEFLQAAEKGLDGTDPVLLNLLAEEEDAMFGASPHTGLLWALETLAWSPEHLCRACLLLAKLARLDPGGRLANRPAKSLRDIFLPWYPLTSATLEQRLRVLDTLRQREEVIAWALMKDLLPEGHSVGGHNPRPRWREWAPESPERTAPEELLHSARELVARMLVDAREDGLRWRDLIGALGELPKEQHELLVDRLSTLDVDQLPTSSRADLWNGLRVLVSKHRSFPDANWALPAERVDLLAEVMARFEPLEPGSRFGFLFAYRPELPDGRERDLGAYEAAVVLARTEAVKTTLTEFALEGLLKLAEQAPLPFLVGETAGMGEDGLAEEEVNEILGEHLSTADTASSRFAMGLCSGRVRSKGRDWVAEKLADKVTRAWPAPRQAALLLSLRPDAASFDLAASMGPEVEGHYWSALGPLWMVEDGDLERATHKLIDNRRPCAAVSLLGSRAGGVTPSTAVAALEAALSSDERWTPEGYEIGEMLDVIEKAGFDEGRIAKLEWAYLHVLQNDRPPRLLHRELARNSQFFAQIVRLAFRAEDEEPGEQSERDAVRAQNAYRLLNSWRSVPGTRGDGSVDEEALGNWMREARQALEASGHLKIGNYVIGEALSDSPPDPDNGWPHSAIRNAIENAASLDLERGLQIGVSNSRGASFRDPREGGREGRQLAEKYAGFAAIARDHWPRTAAMLDRMAESYRWEARREDQETELREELGF